MNIIHICSVLFGDRVWWCSGLTTDSTLRNHPGRLEDHKGCWKLKLSRTCARQVPYPLYYSYTP